MAANEIHVGDVGLVFLDNLQGPLGPLNVSTANLIQFIFQKPDTTTLTVTALPYTDGTDGNVYYTSQAGDIDQAGTWRMQVFIQIGNSSMYSDIQKFTVVSNLIS